VPFDRDAGEKAGIDEYDFRGIEDILILKLKGYYNEKTWAPFRCMASLSMHGL
jgi:hypothetical protein